MLHGTRVPGAAASDGGRPDATGPRGLGGAAAATFVLLWSSGAIAVSIGLGETDAVTFLALRALGAAMVSWLVWLVVRDQLPRTRPDWLRTVAVAVLLQVGYQMCFFLALANRLPAGLLAVIVGVQPVLTALITRSGRGRRLWTGLLLGLVGVAFSVSSSIAAPSEQSGVLFGLGALLAITVGTIVQGRIRTVGTWASLSTQSTIAAATMLLTAGVVNGRVALPQFGTFYLALGWMVLVVSVGATALLYTMVTRAETVRVTSLFYCVPPVTAALDYLVFRTLLGPAELFGMALVVIALVLIQATPPENRLPRSATSRPGNIDARPSRTRTGRV